MEVGIDSFAAMLPGVGRALTPVARVADPMEEVAIADLAGIDTFGIGDPAPMVRHAGESIAFEASTIGMANDRERASTAPRLAEASVRLCPSLGKLCLSGHSNVGKSC